MTLSGCRVAVHSAKVGDHFSQNKKAMDIGGAANTSGGRAAKERIAGSGGGATVREFPCPHSGQGAKRSSQPALELPRTSGFPSHGIDRGRVPQPDVNIKVFAISAAFCAL